MFFKSKYLQSSLQPLSLAETPEHFNNNPNEKQLEMHENKRSVLCAAASFGNPLSAGEAECEQAGLRL